jgi:hypothetical protein
MRDAMPWSGLAAVAVCVSRAAIAALIEHEQMAAVLDRDDGGYCFRLAHQCRCPALLSAGAGVCVASALTASDPATISRLQGKAARPD